MQIIDSHLHFWDLTNQINTWVSKETSSPYLQKNYLPHDIFNSSQHKIFGVVHIEAHDSKIPTITEIEWLQKVMEKNPYFSYRHIAFVDILASCDIFRAKIDELINYPQVVGIRHILSYHPTYSYSPQSVDLSLHPNLANNLRYLKQCNLVFNCQMYYHQLLNILPTINSIGVNTVIDHLALPYFADDTQRLLWEKTIKMIALSNNIRLKVSGIDMVAKPSQFKDIISFCFEHVPFNQLCYGSNYPVSFNQDYNFLYDFLMKQNLSTTEQEHLFYKTAHALFWN